MPQIQDQVAENRDKTRRLAVPQVEVRGQANRTLQFTASTVEVTAEIEVYTRPLGDTLISGHPDAAHGGGRGGGGDNRGSWTLQENTEASALLVRDGRNAVRDSLDGQKAAGAVKEIAVGTDSTDVAVGDSALGAETGRAFAFGLKDSAAVTRGRGLFLFAEDGLLSNNAVEYGWFDDSGTLVAEVTTSGVSVAETEELRVDIVLTVSGTGGGGQAVITNDGETVIADSLKSPKQAVGVNEIAHGTGSTGPSKSDTSLANETYRKTALRTTDNEKLTAQIVTPQSEPAGQPVDLTETGAFDNSSTPRLIWRAVHSAWSKDSDFAFSTLVPFRFK